MVELISKNRQNLPNLDAIYFLSPTVESFESLVKDFKNDRKPQYKSAYIFISQSVSECGRDNNSHFSVCNKDILKVIQGCPPLISRIKTFMDFNLHFIAYESRAFHLDMPSALLRIYPSGATNDNNVFLREIASRLATVCLTLGDMPNIRFMASPLRLGETVAKHIQGFMDAISPEVKIFSPPPISISGSHKRSIGIDNSRPFSRYS